MRKRTQSKQIDHHHLAVVVPAIGEKSDLRSPTVRQQRRVLRQPAPINAVKDLIGQQTDLGMFLEVLAAGENSAEQDGGVNRRNLGIPHSLAGVNVGEMVEE